MKIATRKSKLILISLFTVCVLSACGRKDKKEEAPAKKEESKNQTETPKGKTTAGGIPSSAEKPVISQTNGASTLPTLPVRKTVQPVDLILEVESPANSDYALKLKVVPSSLDQANLYSFNVTTLVPDGKKAVLTVEHDDLSFVNDLGIATSSNFLFVYHAPDKFPRHCIFKLHEDSARGRVVAEKDFNIPVDSQIKETHTVDSPANKFDVTGLARFIAEKNAKLETQGKPVRIVTNSLEIRSATFEIETFPKEAKAGEGKPGRSGGSIEVRAKRAKGRLKIVSRGEAGGEGADGGDTARVLVVIEEKSSQFSVEIEEQPGLGSTGRMNGKTVPYCIQIGDSVKGDCEAFKKN